MGIVTSELKLSLIPTELPFLPGSKIQFAWDSVSLTTAMSCPQRYKLGILEGWTPKQPGVAIALAFGLLIHKGIELFHKARTLYPSYDEAVEQALWAVYCEPDFARLPVLEDVDAAKKELDDAEDESDGILVRNAKVRTRYHLFRALVWYFEQYRNDPLRVVHLANGQPAVEHSFRIASGRHLSDGTELMLSGHLDRLVDFNGERFVVDYKTTKAITQQWREDFKLSHQMTGYTLGGKIGFDQKTKGVFIDGIALQVGGVKFARFPTYRSAGQLEEYLDLLSYIGEAAERWFTTGYYPMNDKACYFCEFRQICSQDPKLRAGYLNMYYERKPAWNPLANR